MTDKVEIFRDLSTYEYNFAKKQRDQVGQGLFSIKERIYDT